MKFVYHGPHCLEGFQVTLGFVAEIDDHFQPRETKLPDGGFEDVHNPLIPLGFPLFNVRFLSRVV